ncbi:MAG TPA: TIGR04076 family protein [Anaerolineae bacterium]|nr:TIGR04076 family protein [Anaerolineae bacterium]
MYELNISVAKVLGTCTADPPMRPGQYFTVSNGDIRIPQGSYVCAWALHSLLPVITPKERKILESEDDDWMWRVHRAQCPDPDGRVVFEIELADNAGGATLPPAEIAPPEPVDNMEGGLWNLQVVVDEVRGKCTSGMKPGDYFQLRSGRLYIPARRHFCLYALQATFPFLTAKQRPLPEDDWLNRTNWILCPDPAGSVILRIERVETDSGGS